MNAFFTCDASRSLRRSSIPLIFLRRITKNPGPGAARSVIVQLHIGTHDACVVWLLDMSYGSTDTINNVAEYWGLVNGIRQAQLSRLSPLHVVGDSALVLSQLSTRHPPRKPHLARLFRKFCSIENDIDVFSWGHLHHTYTKMAYRLAHIDTGSSIQVHAISDHNAVKEVTTFLNKDVNNWLEASQADN